MCSYPMNEYHVIAYDVTLKTERNTQLYKRAGIEITHEKDLGDYKTIVKALATAKKFCKENHHPFHLVYIIHWVKHKNSLLDFIEKQMSAEEWVHDIAKFKYNIKKRLL